MQEKAPTNNTIDLELTRRLIVKGPLDIVFEDASIEDREGLVELLTGGEISSSNLSNIAEYLGYITQKSLVEVLGIEADLTLEKVKTILTGTNIPKTNGKIDYSQIKEPHERAKVRYYELFLNSQGDMPTIVDGKTIEEIFKVLDPDAFRSSEPLTLRKILEKSYKRLPKETKKEIKDATKQKDDAEKTETTSEQDKKIDPNIKSFLEQIFAVKPEDLKGFLDKSIGQIVDESNQQINQGENPLLSEKELELFKNIYATHSELNNQWIKIIEGRIEKGKKIGKTATLVLLIASLILIWRASKEKYSTNPS